MDEVLETIPLIENGTLGERPVESGGESEFKNVKFKYFDSDDYVLENISFTARQSETIPFIGATGCRKSTLVNLIPRFYDVTDGEILVKGMNVKEYAQQFLRHKLGDVLPKAILFEESVSSNVAFGDNEKGLFEM